MQTDEFTYSDGTSHRSDPTGVQKRTVVSFEMSEPAGVVPATFPTKSKSSLKNPRDSVALALRRDKKEKGAPFVRQYYETESVIITKKKPFSGPGHSHYQTNTIGTQDSEDVHAGY